MDRVLREDLKMTRVEGWTGIAFNQVPDSDNRIHSDELARAYGFTGALVPGVTISSCLIHPAVMAWGLDWLSRGHAHVVVKSPLYDLAPFRVEVSDATDHSYEARLRTEDRLSAWATVILPGAVPEAPLIRNDPLMTEDCQAPVANRKTMEALKTDGCRAHRFQWQADHEMARYLRDQEHMAPLLRTDGQPGSGGFANMAFLLGCANRHFAAVAQMSPWIHLETRSQNFSAVAMNTPLISEMSIVDLFERKGHEFADCRFNLFNADSGECVCTVEQRAIYQLRAP